MIKRIALVVTALAGCGSAAASVQHHGQPEAVYYADSYADHYGVPRELVHAIITQESGWRATVVSNKGAMGLMQLMPATAQQYRVSQPFSIQHNIRGGVKYLASLMRRFNGELRLVVAAYYSGTRHVGRRGLNYANQDVVQYVASVRNLYRAELALHSARPKTTPNGDVQ